MEMTLSSVLMNGIKFFYNFAHSKVYNTRMPIKKILFCFIILLILSFALKTNAQQPVPTPELQTLPADSLDSLKIAPDTIPPKKTNAIDAPVYYQSKDSIVMMGTKFIYLFGEGNVKYLNLELTADYIEVDTDKSVVYATFATDSIGDEIGYPIFKEGESQYESKTMRYNFRTKRGFITDVITQQGEGFITSARTKKMENDDLFMVDGKYTTCDEHDHPHFYLNLTKAKVRPGKDIVTGPAYLVLEDVPLPIAIPFGYFPFKTDYASGIIMPTYGDEVRRGFSLRDGGYYFAFSDYIDMELTGEIHTRGSWGLKARSSYRKRYKYSGSFDLGYLVTVLGDKGEPDYSISKDFRALWSHLQDPKSNPYRTLSASVNFTKGQYDRNQVNGFLTGAQNTNQKASSINISQTFPNSPFALNMGVQINQRNQDSTVSVTPSFNVTMRQIFPFKRKNPVGSQRWYEAIAVSYQGRLNSGFSGKEDQLFNSNFLRDWRSGMTHSIPVSATFNLLNYINITPNFTYEERWNTAKVAQDYDPLKNGLVPVDTTFGFFRSYNYSASVGLNTRLYGFFKPWKIFGDKVQMIRHVMTPNISFSGSPNFTDPMFGSYVDKTFIDRNGDLNTKRYSPFANSLFPPAGGRASATMGFGISNNVEMKVKSDSDSTGVKKISLIDQLSLNSGYNFMAREYNWSDISMNVRLKLSQSLSINLSLPLDVYTYDNVLDVNGDPTGKGKRVNVTRWEAGKGIGRFRGTSYTFSQTINNDTFKKWFGGKDSDSDNKNKAGDNSSEQTDVASNNAGGGNTPLRSGKKERGEFDADGYAVFTIPWSLSLNYGIVWGYDYSSFNTKIREYDYKLTHSLGLSGSIQPTKGWRFNYSTSYDFERSQFAQMICTITRELHCWSMSASFNPVGQFQYYNFTIAVKSSLLSDLKYNQSNFREPTRWE